MSSAGSGHAVQAAEQQRQGPASGGRPLGLREQQEASVAGAVSWKMMPPAREVTERGTKEMGSCGHHRDSE